MVRVFTIRERRVRIAALVPRLLVPLFLFSSSVAMHAQVAQDAAPPSVAYSASAEGSLAAGNVRRVLVALRGDLEWTGSTFGAAAEPTFVYGEQGDAVRERDVHTRGFLYFHPRDRWFGFAVTGFETNRQRRVDYRWQAGVGIGRRLLDTPRQNLRVTLAVLRERTRLEIAPRGGGTSLPTETFETTDHWRTTLRFKGAHQRRPFRLQEEAWWQPAFGAARGQRWHAQASVDVIVGRGVSFRTTAEEHYESHVAPGVRANDFRLTFGIALTSKTTTP